MKKAISLILIAGSLVFALLIITEKPKTGLVVNFDENKPIQRVENISELTKNQNINLPNFTNALAGQIASNLSQEKAAPDIQNPEKYIENILSEEMVLAIYQKIKPNIDPAEIKTISDNSPEALRAYAKNSQKIFTEHLSGLSASNPTNPENYLKSLAVVYQKIVADLYLLETPQSLTSAHRQSLSLISAQKNILDILVKADKDPAAAIVAFQLLPTINTELQEVELEIRKIMNS